MLGKAMALRSDPVPPSLAPTSRSYPLALEVAGLVRSFGGTKVLSEVDFVLHRGGVFGLLGPNGAGKTTTVRILTGVLRPDRAHCLRVLGHDVPGEIDQVR